MLKEDHTLEDMKVYCEYLKEKHRSLDLRIKNFYNSFTEEQLKKMKIQRLHCKDEMTFYQRLIEQEEA